MSAWNALHKNFLGGSRSMTPQGGKVILFLEGSWITIFASKMIYLKNLQFQFFVIFQKKGVRVRLLDSRAPGRELKKCEQDTPQPKMEKRCDAFDPRTPHSKFWKPRTTPTPNRLDQTKLFF